MPLIGLHCGECEDLEQARSLLGGLHRMTEGKQNSCSTGSELPLSEQGPEERKTMKSTEIIQCQVPPDSSDECILVLRLNPYLTTVITVP